MKNATSVVYIHNIINNILWKNTIFSQYLTDAPQSPSEDTIIKYAFNASKAYIPSGGYAGGRNTGFVTGLPVGCLDVKISDVSKDAGTRRREHGPHTLGFRRRHVGVVWRAQF